MAKIILDFGSGNTCMNNEDYAKRMIDNLALIDTQKHDITIKWQLWHKENEQGNNIYLDWILFHAMAVYAFERYGYLTTASVFDKESVKLLLNINLPYDIPFIKIACNENLYPLLEHIPAYIPVIVSKDKDSKFKTTNSIMLFCVPEYPAKIEDYPKDEQYVSDHTIGLELFKRNNPKVIEMHYALSDSKGLDVDTGICKTPEMLKEIL